jgi:hypothetical protein
MPNRKRKPINEEEEATVLPVEEIANETRAEEADDLRFEEESVSGDTVIVARLNRRFDPPVENKPDKYSRILQRMLQKHGYVVIQGNGNNAGLALSCARMLRRDLSRYDVKTRWLYVGDAPTVLVTKFERRDGSIGTAQTPILRLRVEKL